MSNGTFTRLHFHSASSAVTFTEQPRRTRQFISILQGASRFSLGAVLPAEERINERNVAQNQVSSGAQAGARRFCTLGNEHQEPGNQNSAVRRQIHHVLASIFVIFRRAATRARPTSSVFWNSREAAPLGRSPPQRVLPSVLGLDLGVSFLVPRFPSKSGLIHKHIVKHIDASVFEFQKQPHLRGPPHRHDWWGAIIGVAPRGRCE
jgi:hypothetical protein